MALKTPADYGIPTYFHMMWSLVLELRELGGSGTIREIDSAVIEHMGFTEEQQLVAMANHNQSAIEYRLAWARTHLKGAGLLTNSQRAVWSLTRDGWDVAEEDVMSRVDAWREEQKTIRTLRKALENQNVEPEIDEGPDDSLEDDNKDWKLELLERIWSTKPESFERLCQRLLRESGFDEVEVLGRSGDGGIDGVGILHVSLVSFHTFFQSKRYRPDKAVRSPDIRDFRGALQGRGEKGLFITTSRFTEDARQEAKRPGAVPIELIDGERLCELLLEYELGVHPVMTGTLDESFFADFP